MEIKNLEMKNSFQIDQEEEQTEAVSKGDIPISFLIKKKMGKVELYHVLLHFSEVFSYIFIPRDNYKNN